MRAVGVHQGHATGVAFIDQTTAASAGADGVVRIWNVGQRRPIRILTAGVPLTDLAASTDGRTIAASAADGRVFVWRTDGRRIATLAVSAPARSVAFSKDGRFVVVAAGDKTAQVAAIAGGASPVQLDHPAAVNDAAFSPDGTLIATASVDGLVRLWSAATGKLIATLEGHDASVLSVTFSHDGKLLLSSSLDHDLRIWSVARRTSVRVLRGHVALVSGGAFSADDRWVASAGPGKVGVWAVEGDDFPGDRLFYLSGSTGPLAAVAFSPSGNEIVSAGQDGAIRKYDCAVCGGLPQLSALARAATRS
jgi:dipeptidyl aminopeptidase/acylaminoacyl peptidase